LMGAFGKDMQPRDLAAQLRMERQLHKGAFILVEGANDIKRFQKFFREGACSFVNCYGKDNVVGTIEIEENDGREDVLGLVDSDFDKFHQIDLSDDNLIVSCFHDFDLDVCSTEVVGRYLVEMSQEHKVSAKGGAAACVAGLLEALKPLSAARYASVKYNLRYSFKNLDYETFFDGSAINVAALIDHLSTGALGSAQHREVLADRINQFVQSDIDLWHVTNGHDFMAALGIALRCHLGNRWAAQTGRGEIERHLRLAFDIADFAQCGLLEKLTAWEQRNPKFAVLRP
jgi:hypothetical protein